MFDSYRFHSATALIQGLNKYQHYFGVSRVGVTIGSMYHNLVPIVVVLISISLGRYPSLLHLLAGALIIAGVVYIQLRNFSTSA